MYKVVQGKRLASYKNGFANLAIPVFAFYEPQPPKGTLAKLSSREWTWTAWDKLDLAGDLTLKQLMDHFQAEHGLEVTMLSYGVSILYSFFQQKKKAAERMPLPMSKVVELVTGKPLNPDQKYVIFEVMCQNEDGDEVELPCIRMVLN